MTPTELFALVNRLMEFKLFIINQTPITCASVIMFITVLCLFGLGSFLARRLILDRALTRFIVEDGTRYNLHRLVHYSVMLIGSLVAFQFIGVDLSGLAVIFGLLSVGIGFGLQNVTSNFVSGLIILFEQPIRVGDRVTVNGVEGDVIEINMRSTLVRSLNNISIIVPNSDFVSTQVVNWTHRDPKVRLSVDVGVAYSSDLDTVLRVLREVGEQTPDVLQAPPVEVLHLGFGDSAWNMQLRVWIADPKRSPLVKSALHCAIVRRFREAGIEIPFPQQDLHVHSDRAIAPDVLAKGL